MSGAFSFLLRTLDGLRLEILSLLNTLTCQTILPTSFSTPMVIFMTYQVQFEFQFPTLIFSYSCTALLTLTLRILSGFEDCQSASWAFCMDNALRGNWQIRTLFYALSLDDREEKGSTSVWPLDIWNGSQWHFAYWLHQYRESSFFREVRAHVTKRSYQLLSALRAPKQFCWEHSSCHYWLLRSF